MLNHVTPTHHLTILYLSTSYHLTIPSVVVVAPYVDSASYPIGLPIVYLVKWSHCDLSDT